MVNRNNSKTQEILKKMRDDQKVQVVNTTMGMATINAMNLELEEMRREFQIKESKSGISAKSIILT
ncbi:hypothetical protein [Arthrospiribacter ruber]|uniref:hypothetical protein n=1 Tax=Arthrospiribacter ruber TaxID=2487934 RepID=UPI001C5ACCAD|nr:hypothetical protein [Arthrospiribacter ruber]